MTDKLYKKHHSFSDFICRSDQAGISVQKERVIKIIKNQLNIEKAKEKKVIYQNIISDLRHNDEPLFTITPLIADDLSIISDDDVSNYLFHRYRYDVFPQTHTLDKFPPYLQIEPTSVCNFRCVFCYQTDTSFSNKKNGYMGNMPLSTYKEVVDQAQGNIEFISLASRGEPLICKELPEMLEYSVGKFLNLKINTNASLLTEELCHSLLNGAIKTIVFSADAAEEPLYSQMRVNGKLDKTLKNIEMFHNIREKNYREQKVLTRVSGVKYSDKQDMLSMLNLWSGLVDQISFVNYNPWEDIYSSDVNDVSKPCSDLWRRMFVWYDGKVNPCDSDYKSTLLLSNIKDISLSDVWASNAYQSLREKHLDNKRNTVEPCKRCYVV